MIGFILTVLFIILYVIYFQIKSLRDYINEYFAGQTHRWDDSIFKDIFPLWFQGYLLDDPVMFIGNRPPEWFRAIVWSEYNGKFRTTSIDGWHQLDGLIFLVPYWYVCLVLQIYVWKFSGLMFLIVLFVVPFVIWYNWFNFSFHVMHRKTNKEWNRIGWPFTLLKKFYKKG